MKKDKYSGEMLFMWREKEKVWWLRKQFKNFQSVDILFTHEELLALKKLLQKIK